ncbi:hypothetical protein [Candidatus Harpocratesius sp.]
MILFFILTPIEGSPILHYQDDRAFQKIIGEAVPDPFIIIQMAKSLYLMGKEMQTGGLQKMDMTSYKLFTHLNENLLLIIGVHFNRRNQKKFETLKEALPEIHSQCLRIVKKAEKKMDKNITELLDNIEINEIIKPFPLLRKEFRHLSSKL